MKFLADQDVYANTVRLLSRLGHDVVTAGQLRLAQAQDTELLRVAHEQGRILVTRDRDFGALARIPMPAFHPNISGLSRERPLLVLPFAAAVQL